MTTTIKTERRKRGVVGWIFLSFFLIFNAFMAFAMYAGLSGSADRAASLTSDAAIAGNAAGTALAAGMTLIFWAAGTVILGALVLLTRGRKIITETTLET